MEQYSYSWNDENYYGAYDTEEEAIKEAKEDRPEATYVYIGSCTEPTLKWDSNEESIIESIKDNLNDEVGEAAENFDVDMTDEFKLARMINKTVELWILENNVKPNCYAVLDGHRVELN